MREFIVDNTVFQPTFQSGIDLSEYEVIEERRRFSVLQNKKGDKFLIQVGYRENQRSTVVCKSMGELVTALALVRTAFPNSQKKK